jgi:2-polyprenyl-6-methoxyphenol hydroxylase-like FAD-dependent oxidoreductase
VLERKKRSNSSCGQDWSELAKANDLLKVIANSEISCINLKCLIDNSSTILYYNVVDRDPLPYWTSGVVTLLGDAAHPMYPFGSNGACQAILDAVSLSSSLLNIESTSAALSEYEMQRREATSRVVLLNREMPPDSILEIVDDRLRDNPTVLPRDAITPNEISEISERYKQVTGFAVSQLSPERA